VQADRGGEEDWPSSDGRAMFERLAECNTEGSVLLETHRVTAIWNSIPLAETSADSSTPCNHFLFPLSTRWPLVWQPTACM
jgi:hypothetical protein